MSLLLTIIKNKDVKKLSEWKVLAERIIILGMINHPVVMEEGSKDSEGKEILPEDF